jgi:hypothetical protein
LAVSLYPTGGFSSATLTYEAAEHMNALVRGKSVVILYVGDYDPAGVLIDVHVERELRKHLRPDIDLQFHRLGITREQIAALDLPTKPRKSGDRRALHVTSTVEAEAMPAWQLRLLVRSYIEAYLPEDALFATQVAEQSEREWLVSLASLPRE